MNFNAYKLVNKLQFEYALRPYVKCAVAFKDYLENTADMRIVAHGYNWDTEQYVGKTMPYIHRFTEIYMRSLAAKMYKLEEWHKETQKPVTLITLTTSHRGKDIYEAFDDLKNGWFHLYKHLQLKYPKFDYYYIFEPHKTGYPHIHVMIFEDIPNDVLNEFKTLWSKKWNLGSYNHGLDGDNRNEDGVKEDISSLRNYLMKYLSKSIMAYSSNVNDKNVEMTPAIFVFHSVAWDGKYRLWGCSRALSKVMRPEKKECDDNIEWFKIQITGTLFEPCTIWDCDDEGDLRELVLIRYDMNLEMMKGQTFYEDNL